MAYENVELIDSFWEHFDLHDSNPRDISRFFFRPIDAAVLTRSWKWRDLFGCLAVIAAGIWLIFFDDKPGWKSKAMGIAAVAFFRLCLAIIVRDGWRRR